MSELLPISLVAEWVYCRRGAWLAHAAGVFQANEFTVDGELLHARVHSGGEGRERGRRQWRRVPVGSHRLGVVGYADVVEETESGLVVVEYKRGVVRERESDRVQVALQALCLEEMTRRPVPEGRIYYAGSRRRVVVPITAALEAQARTAIQALREDLAEARPPSGRPGPRCRGCAQEGACLVALEAPLRGFDWRSWVR